MIKDSIDILIDDWKTERPDLDPSAMGVVGRILVLALYMGRSVSDVLGKQGISLWAFDVLATLRRKGKPFRLSPSAISRSVMLSPAAMVNRLDRLEEAGLVKRRRNLKDRRGLLIELTQQGKETVDAVIGYRFAEADRAIAGLSKSDRKTIAELLHKLLQQYEQP
jgi:DNA-binding MarR family transcriptional regulator